MPHLVLRSPRFTPDLSSLAHTAMDLVGTPMDQMADDTISAILTAWNRGDILPVLSASAEWAFQHGHPLENDDVAEGLIALLLERAVREGSLVREGRAAPWGISCTARDALTERFRSATKRYDQVVGDATPISPERIDRETARLLRAPAV